MVADISIICFVQLGCSELVYSLVFFLSFFVIFVMAPVENDNKLLDQTEYRIYRKRTRLVLLLEGILFMLASFLGWKELMVVLTIVFFIVGISLLAGKVKRQLQI